MAFRQLKNILQYYKYICENAFDINQCSFNFLILKDLNKNIVHNYNYAMKSLESEAI